MDMWVWIIFIVLFFMILDAKSDIRKLEWQLEKYLNPQPAPKHSDSDNAVTNLAENFESIEIENEKITEPVQIETAEPKESSPITETRTDTATPPAPKKKFVLQQGENGITFLGQKLITWIAGFAAVLGFFYFVRYSIENGLLGPVARLSLAAGGGLILIGVGCWLHFKKEIANHERIGEALTGAGIAALYFSAYALSKIYALAPTSVSFGLMCVVTIATIILTLRYGGITTAILALIGGFLTPALTASTHSGIAGFSLYLLTLTVALLFVSRRLQSVLLALLVLSGLYIWTFLWIFLYFVPGDSVWLFLLTIFAATATIGFFRETDLNPVPSNTLQNISFAFCIIFTISFLLKTDFGRLEWGMMALLSAALITLTFLRRATFLPLLIVTEFTVFLLLALWETFDLVEKQWIFAGFATLTLLPFYIAVWVKPRKEFVAFPLIAAPLIYGLAYFVFNGPAGLPYIGLTAATALAVQVCRFDLQNDQNKKLAGLLFMSAATLTTMAMASLVHFNFWPVVLAIEILILGTIMRFAAIKNLATGMRVGSLLFVLVQYKNILFATGLILFGPIRLVWGNFYFYASYLSASFYISYIIVPALAFAALAYICQDKTAKNRAIAAATALIAAGAFSFYMLVRMKFVGVQRIAPNFVDYTLITNLLLLGGIGIFHSSFQNICKFLFGLGLWRLIGIGFLLHSPFFILTQTSAAAILFAYGTPLILFSYYALKAAGIVRDRYIQGAAAMSFVLISALLTNAFYGSLDLMNIHFSDHSVFAYSAAWLLLGCAWLAVAFRCRALVKPAFGLIYFVIAKVFLYDVSSLDGIWRISALFGLAGALLGISYFYSRYFQPHRDQ